MKSDSKLLTAIGLYHLANDGTLIVLPLLLPVIRTFIPMTYTQIGILTAIGLMVTLLSQLFVSEFAHRLRADRALVTGMVIMFVFSTMMILTRDYASLLVFVIGMRIGAAAYHPLALAIVARRFREKSIDMAMGVQSSAGDIGVFMAFLTTGLLGAWLGWKSSFLLWGAVCLTAAMVGIFLNTGKEKAFSTEVIEKRNEPSWSEAFRYIGILIIPLTVGGAGYNIIVNYAPLMFRDFYNLQIEAYTPIIALWVGTGAIFTIVFGKISTRFGRGRIILISYILILASGFMIWMFEYLWTAVLAMFLYGVGLFMTYPALFSYVTENAGEKRSERAFGIVFTAQLTGGFIFSFICGAIADAYSIKTPFVILSMIALLALIVTSIYLSKKQEKNNRNK